MYVMKMPVFKINFQHFLAVISFVFALPSNLFAQAALEFSGYVVQFPVYQRLDAAIAQLSGISRDQTVDATRVRLRPSLSWGENSFFMLEHEVSAVYTFNTLGLLSSPTAARRQLVDLSWDLTTGSRWFIRHFVDRMYLRMSFSSMEVTVGRQRIAWGSGRVWNPTDLFNPISPTSFSKVEKDGADAVVAKTTLGQFSDVTVVWNPQKDQSANVGIRARTNFEGYDLAGIAGVFDSRTTFGVDAAGSAFDAGLRFEMLFSANMIAFNNNYLRWIFGVDNQFTERLYALFEMQFNGEGRKDKLRYDIQRLLRGEILNVARHYGTVQASYLIHPLVTVTGSWLQNWTDGSGYYGGGVQVSMTNEVAGALGIQLFHGGMLTEYWYFPTTVYARADAYF